MDRAAASFNDWARTNDDTYIAKLRESGYEVLELTAEQRAALADHIRSVVWPQVEETVGKEIIERLRADM